MPENKLAVVSNYLPVLNPFPTRSESLVLRAEGYLNLGSSEKLSADDRRDALAYLMGVRTDLSNVELGRLFKVDEKTIRKDRDEIRKRMSEEITKDDISLVVSDIRRGYERIMTDLSQSTKKAVLGTTNKLNHLKAEFEMQLKIVEALQSLGYYPKNLGNLTKTEFIFKAHAGKGGGVNTVAVSNREELKTIEAQEAKFLPVLTEETKEDQEIRAEFESQFSETPKELPSGPS